MKKLLLALFAILMFVQTTYAGKVVCDVISSRILGADVKYNVYLPNGFDGSDKLYPVVYLLHGLSDDQDGWRDKGRMQLVADELIESGEAAEMVIVMPAAGGPDTHHTPCGYFNMPGWSYEDFFFSELMPEVEKKYRCISDKGHRAVMGLSMGGGGSTVYCQRHPDKFSSCYAMSAWLSNNTGVVKANQKGEVKEKDWRLCTIQSVNDHSPLDYLSKADKSTIAKLKTVKWTFDCGDDDGLLNLSVDLHLLMKKAGIKSELRVRNGKHNWEYWHLCLRDALPFASRNFDR